MTSGRMLVVTEADLRILREVARAYQAGTLSPRSRGPHRALQEPPPGFWARLTSEATGGGGYYSWTRLKDDGETLVDPPMTGTDDAKEVQETEGLKVGATDGTVVWLEKDYTDDPAEWRFAHEYQFGTAEDPAIILPADFEQETIAEDTWDRDSPPEGKDGVQVRVQTRTAYNHEAGVPLLLAFYREFLYDSRGNLKSISVEHRVTVDTPEACP